MKAFVLDAYGKGARLRLAELPDPKPGDDDVLIEVHAAGLNPLDSKIRDGAFKLLLPNKMPLILGHDVAGRIVAVGRAVRGFTVGDQVFARPRDGRIGTLATLIAVPAADVALKPASLSMEEAAALPLTTLTAWQALVEHGGVVPGSRVLIHAGSGGVGVAAIQLAKHLGANVATTVSSAGADLVRKLGADVVIDYRAQDFSAQLSGYNLVLASQDTATLARSIKVLKPGGKLISLSGPPDLAFARARGLGLPMRLLFNLLSLGIRRKAKAKDVSYEFLFMHADGAQLGQIAGLVDAGAIKPVIDRSFDFASVNDAFAYLDTGHAKGKVVVTMPTVGAA